MANGYLGKISAIVSANTADFDGKLSKSAKEVSSFARSVQSNLTSASRQAARSLEGIYTPLQKFERSLQAAASMKLSFKGFPGMIKDLDSLQSRLNSALSKRQVDIVLKTTGMSSVSALRDAISGLKSKDIEIITRFGGLDKVRELRDKISSSQPVIDVRVEIENAKNQIATVNEQINAAKKAGGTITVGVDTAEIDRLTGKLATATAALADLRKQASQSSGSSSGLEQIVADIDELNSKRAKLESKAIRVRGDERELQSVNRQIDAISKKIESLETKKAKLSVSTEDFTTKIDNAQKLVDRLTAKLEKARASGATADVKELEQQLAAAEKQAGKLERKLAKTIKVNVGVDADLGELNAVIKKAEDAGTVLGKLPALMDALGKSDFSAASDKMRQLQSVTTEITAPLESSVKKLAGLGAEVAGAFQPALKSAQKGVEMINAAIERQGSASGTLQDKTLESYYDSVRGKVERTIASIERLNQVSSQIGQLKTGKEFVFEQPRLNEAINKGGDIGNRAAALPAEALRTNPAIAQSLVDIRRLSDEAGVAYAKFLAIKDQKQPTGEAQKELDAVVKKLLEAQGVAEKEIKVVLDVAEADAKATALKAKIVALKENVTFTVTGKVQNIDQARSELARLQGDLSKLDESQRRPIAGNLVKLGKLVDSNEITSLDAIRKLITQIENTLGKKLSINLRTDQAKKAADELAASLAKFRESVSFTITGKVQNLEQARSELGRLQSDVDKLTEPQKIAIAPQLQKLGELVAGNQIKDLEKVQGLIADIATQAGSAIKLNLDTAEADAKATELKAKIVALKENVTFTVTGKVQNIDQARSELARLQGDLSKLDESQRRPIAGNLVKLGKLVEAGDVTSLDTVRKLITQIENTLGKKLSINLRTDQAKKAADELAASLAKFKESISFTITGKVQNVEQARSELGRLQSDVDKLTESQKIAIEPKLQKLGELVAGNQIKDLEQVRKLIADIVAQAGSDTKFNLDTDEAEQKTKALRAKIVALKENVTFTVTGKVQNFDQARGEMARLQAEMGKLDATQRAPIARKIVALGKLVDTGEIKSLDDVRVLIERIEKAVGKKLRLNIDKSNLDKLKESISFTITGKVQNVEQARAELGRLQSDVNKLTDSQRITIAPKLQALGELVSSDKITDLEQVRKLIADITALAGDSIQVNLNTADAEKKATELKGRLDALRAELRFSVSGSFGNAGQIEAEVSRITADIQKLDDTQKAAFGQRAMLVIDLLGDDKIQEAAISARNLRSELDQQIEVKVTTTEAQKAIDDLKAKMAQAREQTAFVITGRPQNIQQADSRRAGIDTEIGTLDRSQRQNLKPLLEAADVARATGDLDKINDALDNLAFKVAEEKRVNVKTAEAKKNVDDLKATMDSLRAESKFVISGYVQNPGQAEAEIKRIISGIEKLDAAQKQALQPQVNAAISSLGMKDAKTGLPDIAAIQVAVSNLKYYFDKELVIKVNKDDAQKSVDELKASLGSIADKIGDPSQPIDRLRQAVEAANAAIAKMPAGAIKSKLQADLNSEKARIEAAARPGVPAPSATGIDAAAARANAIAASATAATPAKAAANPLGADFGTAERSLASLQSNVISLQGSLEKLPVPMQTQFIPAINKVREAFKKITPASTAAEIESVTKKAAGLERALTRAGQAAKFGGTIGEALSGAAITRTEKQLGFIRSKLLEVGATASGPVADAFNAYSAAAANAAKSGTSGTAKTKQELDGLIAKIGEALVAEGKLTAAQGKAFNKSVGDVGRAGADKFALALNQAIFAVDDFMSSTGGLEFKLRAVSNNITQLGFVLGGTTGLFVGLGAVIAGQAAVGLIKWINNGRSAEDQTKALNEALARQKSLVEELAQAFESLGDAMSRGTFSAGGEQAAEFSRQIEEIKKKQGEARENRVADLDPKVQQERAEQNKLKGQLEKETDPGRRIAITREMADSQRRERDASEVAVLRQPAADEARVKVRESMIRIGLSELGPNRGDDPTRGAREQQIRERAAAKADAIPVGAQPEDIRAQMAGVNQQIEDAKAAAAKPSPLGFATSEVASKEILKLEQLLRSLEQPLSEAVDRAAVRIADSARGPAAQIRQAQEDVAEAIRKGVPNAAAFQRELDANAKKLKEAYASLEDAQNETDLDKKQAKVDEAQKNVADVEAEQANIRTRSREMRLGRTFGGDRTTAALSSLDGNERFRNESARTSTYLARAIDRELEARRELEAATAKGVDAEIDAAEASLEAAQQASEAAAAFAEAALAIESALTRIRKVGESALQKSEQGADAAQKAFEENPLRAGGLESRDDAERRLIDDRARVGSAQDDLDNRRREIQHDPKMEGVNDELEAITQRRKDLEGKSRTDGQLAPAEQKELDAARKREIELMRQREHLARDLTAAEQKQLDAINNGILAREKELEALRRKAESDPSFDRRRDAAGQIAEDARRQADEAQQRYINNPTDENKKRRDEADQRYREDRKTAEGLQDDLDAKRKGMQKDPRVVAIDKELQANNERLAALAEKEAKGGLTRDELEERKRIQGRNRDRRGERDAIIDNGTKPEQKAIDDAQIAQNQRDRAIRGRDLGMTEPERFRKEIQEGVGADINARAKEMQANGEDPTKFLKQAITNQLESVAPIRKQLQNERENDLLKGPSRAALQSSDVTTTQGKNELNRLLRGDDSARDNVNLAELKKQTEKFNELIKTIKDANPQVLL
jgi:DNA repair exonuclease SbcCD ATPase subunit